MLEGNKQYEIAFLTSNESGKEMVSKALNDIQATVVSEARFSEIRLAYPIKKQMSAGFGSTIFETTPAKVVELDKVLRFTEGVLRFLIVTPVPRKPINTRLRERATDSAEGVSEKSINEEIQPEVQA